jgi:preprotein translocase subunit SecE
MRNPIQVIKQFYGETLQEVKKCSWPSRTELVEQTMLIIAGIALLTVFVFLVDLGCQYVVRGVFNLPDWISRLFS